MARGHGAQPRRLVRGLRREAGAEAVPGARRPRADLVVQPVTETGDPRLEPYRAVRERDLAGREGLFVIEGRVVLEKAAAAMPERIASVLVAEPRMPGLMDVLARLSAETPVYAASQAVMDTVVGFPIHRGILALGRRVERKAPGLLADLPSEALVVGLVGISNHDNIGGVFRNAAAFGADAVILDATCCDPLYRKAIRVSVGAVLTTPFARLAPGEDMAGLLRSVGCEVLALSPAGSDELVEIVPEGRIAALFGAEGDGLPERVMRTVRTVAIPMSNGFDSLNVSTSTGIVLHHLATARRRRCG